jgi:hypothetical protein
MAIFGIDRDYTALQYALFGYGAVNFAKHPEGIVEAKKRQSIENLLESRRMQAERRQQRTTGLAIPETAPPAGEIVGR